MLFLRDVQKPTRWVFISCDRKMYYRPMLLDHRNKMHILQTVRSRGKFIKPLSQKREHYTMAMNFC